MKISVPPDPAQEAALGAGASAELGANLGKGCAAGVQPAS